MKQAEIAEPLAALLNRGYQSPVAALMSIFFRFENLIPYVPQRFFLFARLERSVLERVGQKLPCLAGQQIAGCAIYGVQVFQIFDLQSLSRWEPGSLTKEKFVPRESVARKHPTIRAD